MFNIIIKKTQMNNLNKLGLYQRMCENCNDHSGAETIILNNLKKIGFDYDTIDYFINNYKKIKYTNDNIKNYAHLVYFFDITNSESEQTLEKEFRHHLIVNYIFNNNMLLETLVNYTSYVDDISDILNNNCSIDNDFANIVFTDDDVIYIAKYMQNDNKITKFCAKDNITKKSIEALPDIKHLILHPNSKIFDNDIMHLIYLESLNIYENNKITNVGIENLTNLKKLNISCDIQYRMNNITDKGLQNLCNLEELDLTFNCSITNEGIKNLQKLKVLDITASNITGNGLQKLIALEELYDACGLTTIEDDDIVNLLNLKIFATANSRNVTNKGISKMNLTTFISSGNKNITPDGIKHMTNLKNLNVAGNMQFGNMINSENSDHFKWIPHNEFAHLFQNTQTSYIVI